MVVIIIVAQLSELAEEEDLALKLQREKMAYVKIVKLLSLPKSEAKRS